MVSPFDHQNESDRIKRPADAPGLYLPMGDPRFRTAWEGVAPIDCNLVLEGGSMRELFSAGVLDLLMDEGILPQTVIGVSAGALNGCNYVAGMRGRTCFLNMKYCNNWRFYSTRSLVLKGSIIDTDYVYRKIMYELDPFDFDAFARSPLRLISVVTDLATGQPFYYQHRDLRCDIDYLRASASLPLVTRIVSIEGEQYLDGGLSDPVPLRYSQSLGTGKHLVVLTRDAGFIKRPNLLIRLASTVFWRYPEFCDSLKNRHVNYNRTYEELVRKHEAGEIYVLRPQKPVPFDSVTRDARKLYELYLEGYEEARKNLPAIREYLAR